MCDESIHGRRGDAVRLDLGTQIRGFFTATCRAELIAAVDVGDAEVVAAAAELVDVAGGQRDADGPAACSGVQPITARTAKASR
jgi:hypothetical protein